jgi:hypothetical protein
MAIALLVNIYLYRQESVVMAEASIDIIAKG